MIERLQALLQRKSRNDAPLPEPDARLAMGTLLVRVAMADKAYLFEEIEQIDRILATAYDLNPVEAAKMRATCEKLAMSVEDNAHLAEIIQTGVDYTRRLDKVDALWRVVLADGVNDAREAAVVELVEKVLGVTRSDSEAARAAAVIP